MHHSNQTFFNLNKTISSVIESRCLCFREPSWSLQQPFNFLLLLQGSHGPCEGMKIFLLFFPQFFFYWCRCFCWCECTKERVKQGEKHRARASKSESMQEQDWERARACQSEWQEWERETDRDRKSKKDSEQVRERNREIKSVAKIHINDLDVRCCWKFFLLPQEYFMEFQ